MIAYTVILCALTFGSLGYLYNLSAKRKLTLRINALESKLAYAGIPGEMLKPVKAKKPLPNWLRVTMWAALLFMGGFIGMLASADAHAELPATLRNVLNAQVKNYVTSIMNDSDNNVYIWSKMIMGFLFIVIVIQEISYFIFEGIEAPRLAEAFIYVVMTLIIWNGYDYGTAALWGVGEGISEGLQGMLIDNQDPFFLSQWIVKSLGHIHLPNVDIFDGVMLSIKLFTWMAVCLVLDFVAYLAGLWALYGYALAKIVGMVFVPFLMHRGTRPFFDAWFKFFTGFIILQVVLKATLIIAVMTIKSTLVGLGVVFEGDYGMPTGEPPSISLEGLQNLFDASAMMIIAILFVLSSFAWAAALGAGAGNLSGGLGKAGQAATKFLTKKFL